MNLADPGKVRAATSTTPPPEFFPYSVLVPDSVKSESVWVTGPLQGHRDPLGHLGPYVWDIFSMSQTARAESEQEESISRGYLSALLLLWKLLESQSVSDFLHT